MPISTTNLSNPIQPANTRSVDVARRSLQNVAGQVQQRNLNALAVQGTPIILLRRLQTGKICSCSQHGDPNRDSTDPIGEDGRATQEHLTNILEGGGFGIVGYSDVPDGLGNVTPTAVRESDLNWQSTTSVNTNAGHVVIGDDYDENEELQAQLNAAQEGMTCPCCFGTGFIGGFDIAGGRRLVLTMPSDGEFEVDPTVRPDMYESISEVSWDVQLPRNVMRGIEVKVYKGREVLPPTEYRLTFDHDGGRVALVPAVLKVFASGQKRKLYLDAGQQFTHLELTYLTTDKLPRADLGAVNAGYDPDRYDGTQDISVTMGPDVVDVKPGFLFVDTLYGKLWRVSSEVERAQDGFNNVYGWQVSARVVQSHELHYILGMRNLAVPQRPITNLVRRT